MSTKEIQPGPVRPIPIHLVGPTALDTQKFRIPVSTEKPKRHNPPLWNPALDLCSTSRESAPTRVSSSFKKSTVINIRHSSSSAQATSSAASTPDVQVPSARPLEALSTAVKMPKPFSAPSVGSSKYLPLLNTLRHEQLYRHFPSPLESPLSILTTKELFPTLLGATDTILAHPLHPAVTSHPSFPLTLSDRHMALQNAISLAQARAMMERITSHQQFPRGTLGHIQTHPLNLHQSQPTTQQPTPGPHHGIQNLRQTSPQSETQISLQSSATQNHSRALLERISNNPIISPVISLDNSVAHGYGRKLFPCPQCRYTTDRRNNLKRHMLTMHQTSAKMLECCGILFNTKASLREHAMIFHYHGYTCYFCGRRFCRKALLKRHLSVHNGQKDFVCSVCDYATSHKSNLERHRKVHSRQDDDKDGAEGQHYHDDVKSNGSEALSHEDVSSDDLSVCSDYDDDIDVEINVHSD